MNESYINQIEAYLSGQMSRDEQIQFEQEKEKNEELASAFRVYGLIETTMGGLEQNKDAKASFKKILEEANASYRNGQTGQNPEKTSNLHPVSSGSEKDISLYPENAQPSVEKKAAIKTINVWKKISIAAAVIVIIAYGATLILNKENRKKDIVIRMEKPDSSRYTTDHKANRDSPHIVKTELPKVKPEEFKKDKPPVNSISPDGMNKVNSNALFAENFKPDILPNETPPVLKTALGHYKNEAYKQAISSIDAVLQDQVRGEETTDEEKLARFYAHYYKAQSYLALNRTTQAITELQIIIEESPADKKGSIQWYLALAYLKKGNTKRAKALLSELSQNSDTGKYKALAEKLAQQLQGIK